MSLNFNFSKTEFFATEQNIWWKNADGETTGYLLPELDSIVWGCHIVGVPRLTEKNVGDFCYRMFRYEMKCGPIVRRNDTGESAFDADVARRCVGFSTNSNSRSKADFSKWLTRQS